MKTTTVEFHFKWPSRPYDWPFGFWISHHTAVQIIKIKKQETHLTCWISLIFIGAPARLSVRRVLERLQPLSSQDKARMCLIKLDAQKRAQFIEEQMPTTLLMRGKKIIFGSLSNCTWISYQLFTTSFVYEKPTQNSYFRFSVELQYILWKKNI